MYDPADIPMDAVPAIAEGVNFSSLHLGATEGFLLSRIDGRTNVQGVCTLSNLSEGETKNILRTLVKVGAIVLRDKSGQVVSLRSDPDDDVPIDPNLRLRIEQLLRAEEAGNPYKVLFVEPFSDLRAVKRSYYQLTQDLHPDNYYGQNLGVWEQKLEQAFAAVTKAYEDLSDADIRADVDRRLRLLEGPVETVSPSSSGAAEATRPKVSRKQSGLFQAMKEKIAKAKEFGEQAERQLFEGDFVSAYNSFKLAASYDPYNKDYERNLKMLEGKVSKTRAANTFKVALKKIDNHQEDEAIPLLEEVIETDQSNAQARFELARLLFPKIKRVAAQKQREIRDLAEAAAILEPSEIEYVLLAAKVVQTLGDTERAKELYKDALKLDRKNETAKRALKEL